MLLYTCGYKNKNIKEYRIDTSIVYVVKHEKDLRCRYAFEARFSYIEKSFSDFCGKYLDICMESLMCRLYQELRAKVMKTSVFEIRQCKIPANMDEVDSISASGRIVLLHIKDTHVFLTKINGYLFDASALLYMYTNSPIKYDPYHDMFYLNKGDKPSSGLYGDYAKYCIMYNSNQLSDAFFEDRMFDAAYEVSYYPA